MKELNEVLSRALANSENKGSKKLLTYLKDKILVDWKPQFKQSFQKQEERSIIEKQIETDLNYLNVFVQPIGEINIFQQEKQEMGNRQQARKMNEVRLVDLDEEQLLK